MRAHEFVSSLFEASYDSMIAAMKRKYTNSNSIAAIEWSKNLKRQDRIVWYLRILDKFLSTKERDEYTLIGNQNTFNEFKETLMHYIGQDIPSIQRYIFDRQPALQVFNDLANLEREYLAKLNKNKGVSPQSGDYKLLSFQDGSNWWYIDRAYCPEEGRSGLHCGNIVGRSKTDQRILSYRDKDNRVIMTFILEPDGKLGEMKAKGNLKPEAKYHPVIMQLLLNPIVKGIQGMGYLADMNFNIFDLDESYLKVLREKKPVLITEQFSITPYDALRSPDWLKRELANALPNTLPADQDENLKRLLLDNSLENWSNSVKQNGRLILYAPDNLPAYRELLLNYLITPGAALTDLLIARKQYRNDYDFLTELLNYRPLFIRVIPDTHPRIVDLYKIVLQHNPYYLRNIEPEKLTQELCDIATKENPSLIRYVPDRFKTYVMCVDAIRAQTPESNTSELFSKHIPDRYKTTELCKVALKANPYLYDKIPSNIRTPEFNLEFAKNYPDVAMRKFDYEDLTPEIRLIIVKANNYYFEDMDPKDQTPEMVEYISIAEPRYIRYMRDDLITEQIAMKTIKEFGGQYLKYIPPDVMTYKMAVMAFKHPDQPHASIKDVPVRLITPQLCKLAVKVSFENFVKITLYKDLKKFLNYKLALFAVKTHSDDPQFSGYYLNRVPEEYRDKIRKELSNAGS